MEDGDLTILADRGMNLSRGQQARINLARAVYRKTNIYLLDDSLTALDNHVQDYIFNECLMDFLRDKICILVSQNSQHVKKADQILILKEGKIALSGSINADNEILNEIFEDFSENINESSEAQDKIVANIDVKKACLLQTEQQQSKKNVYCEMKKCGKVDISIYRKYFVFGGGFIIFSLIIVVYIGSQFCESYADKLQSQWQVSSFLLY